MEFAIGMMLGALTVIIVVVVASGSETFRAIDHKIAEKIKGDKPDIDIEVR